MSKIMARSMWLLFLSGSLLIWATMADDSAMDDDSYHGYQLLDEFQLPGEKRAGFVGMRGKKNPLTYLDLLQYLDPEALKDYHYDSLDGRRSRFTDSVARKGDDVEKRAGFVGMRGKKKAALPSWFYPVEDVKSRRAGFVGMRGRR